MLHFSVALDILNLPRYRIDEQQSRGFINSNKSNKKNAQIKSNQHTRLSAIRAGCLDHGVVHADRRGAAVASSRWSAAKLSERGQLVRRS